MSKLNTLKFFLQKKRIIVMCRVFYGEEWMELALKNIEPYVYKILILKSNKTWDNRECVSDNVKPIVDKLNLQSGKYVYIEREWGNQYEQQEQAWNLIKNTYPEATHLMYVDTDEIYRIEDIKKLSKLCRDIRYFNKVLRVNMYTYIKTIYYRVFPLEIYKPIAIIPILDYVHFIDIRQVDGAPKVIVPIYMHHFSLVMKDENRLQMKCKRNVDGYDGVDNWYDSVYKNFNENTKNFHTLKGNESQWASVEVVEPQNLPEGVEDVYKSWNKNE